MTTPALPIILLIALSAPAVWGAPAAVDGIFADWEESAPVWTDPAGDGAAIDFGKLWARSDAERLTLWFEVGSDVNLQNGNAITLLIDGDGDPTTGRATHGIGADLVWTFGRRSGVLVRAGREMSIEQSEIGLLQAPTVSSTAFEVSILRRARAGAPVASGPRISIVLIDEAGAAGDRLPDDDDGTAGDRLPDTGAVTLELSQAPPPSPLPVTLERRGENDVRVLTWNVLFDGLFKRPAPFIRVLRAIDPDVICFQEIWSHTAMQAADQVSLALPDRTWYGANTAEGHVVSRYPLIEARAIDEAGNYWALIDLPDDRYEVDLSLVSAHPPCCDNEEGRQRELDGIAAWQRDLVTPGGSGRPTGGHGRAPGERAPPTGEHGRTHSEGGLPPGTPLIVAGDMNLVGGAGQLATLLAGEIVDEETFGPSRPLDWDGTPLADAMPRLAGGRDVFTWREARSSFAPGRLDYIVYSDSVLEIGNAFVLATEALPTDVLERYGLRRTDTLDASDHLPVVADLTPVAGRSRTETAE